LETKISQRKLLRDFYKQGPRAGVEPQLVVTVMRMWAWLL
jgi:hypothetical protein